MDQGAPLQIDFTKYAKEVSKFRQGSFGIFYEVLLIDHNHRLHTDCHYLA